MKIISDLHLHSKYSRATSKQLDIPNLEKWARVKGLNLLGTSDFTHPEWIKELKNDLTEDETVRGNFIKLIKEEISEEGDEIRKKRLENALRIGVGHLDKNL